MEIPCPHATEDGQDLGQRVRVLGIDRHPERAGDDQTGGNVNAQEATQAAEQLLQRPERADQLRPHPRGNATSTGGPWSTSTSTGKTSVTPCHADTVRPLPTDHYHDTTVVSTTSTIE